ncbi:hypothetical protein [Chromobacterium sp. ASV23]|uniref:hypothetical protein n=1 Tax=Chromobacterium sp. ASV23 TaxID=2795110 RepID=UPI0018EE09D0|nr:hypothetical protein [Chromobacterium sp. ASV23]
MNFAPNLPELMPHNPRFWEWNRVQFNELSASEKVELDKLGAQFFNEYTPEQLAIYRTPKGLTFLTPMEFVEL